MSKRPVEDVYRLIGKKVKDLRILREPRMSQQSLAKELGLSRVSIVNIERGRHRIQVHQIFDLARALGVNAHDLIPVPPTQGAILPPGLSESLKPKERAAVERLLTSKRGSHGE